jgi:hypothetical protein
MKRITRKAGRQEKVSKGEGEKGNHENPSPFLPSCLPYSSLPSLGVLGVLVANSLRYTGGATVE